MGFTHIADATGYDVNSGTTLDCSSTLHVEIGDLLVGVGCNYNGNSTFAMASTVPDNSFTMLTRLNNTDIVAAVGYVVVSVHDVAATFRLTNGTARTYRSFIVMQFRPDAGDTVSIDGVQAIASGSSGTPQSGDIDTVAGDELLIGTVAENGPTGMSERQLGDVAADGFVQCSGNWVSEFYRITADAQTGIHAQAATDNNRWVCGIVGFKSVAGGGGGIMKQASNYYRRLRTS